jgi:hypothetical protein
MSGGTGSIGVGSPPAGALTSAGLTALTLNAVPDGDCAGLGQAYALCMREGDARLCEDFATRGLSCLVRRVMPPPSMIPRVGP